MARTHAVSVAALMWAGLATSCGARRPVALPAPETTDTREGRTRVRVLNPPSAGTGEATASAETITAAQASEQNKLPEYPAYALRAGCQQGRVPVRVHIGTDGNVAAQTDVPGRPLPDDPCHVAFRAAVQGAVSPWKFAPAFRQTPSPGPDVDHDGRPDITHWEQKAVAIYVDFEFYFEVVEGKGVVRTR